MGTYQELGTWIRNQRIAKGIRSAAALSRKAGLSTNYISIIERGEARPRWDTAELIAQALGLSEDERTAFFRVVDAADKPQVVWEAASGAPVPGLVIWSWLPRLLWSVPHKEVTPWYGDPDEVLVDVVRSAASLLSWVALAESGVSPEQEASLLKLESHAKAAAATLRPPVYASGGLWLEDEPCGAAYLWVTLPQSWKRVLLSSESTARDLVAHLAEWHYQPASPHLWQNPAVSFTFHDSRLEGIYGISVISPMDVIRLHDTMIAYRLLAAVKWNHGVTICSEPSRFRTRFQQLLGPTDDELRRVLSLPSRRPDADSLGRFIATVDLWAALAGYGRFVSRAFACERAAEAILLRDEETERNEQPQQDTCAALQERLDARLALLDELLTSAAAAARRAQTTRRQAMLAEHERRMQDPPPDADAPPENPDQAAAGDQATP